MKSALALQLLWCALTTLLIGCGGTAGRCQGAEGMCPAGQACDVESNRCVLNSVPRTPTPDFGGDPEPPVPYIPSPIPDMAPPTLVPADPGPPPPVLCSDDAWCGTNRLSRRYDLKGVWGLNADDVWVVGSGGTIGRWQGCAWGAQDSGTRTDLKAVWGADPNNVLAVGAAGTIL